MAHRVENTVMGHICRIREKIEINPKEPKYLKVVWGVGYKEEIALTPLEFEVFAMLMKYKNGTIPRDKLLNEIWGIDFFGGTRTVDVHIANIRRKLDINDMIKTVPKYGYRLED